MTTPNDADTVQADKIEAEVAITKFLDVFSNTMDFGLAATAAGCKPDYIAQRFEEDEALCDRLSAMLYRRLKVVDVVPAAIVKAQMLRLLCDESQPGTVRVNAGRSLIDLLQANPAAERTVGDLLSALRGDGEGAS